jgi:nucleoside-diphosphate kinase
MSGNRTLTIIKPDAVERNNIGNILQKINENGFRIVALKLTKLSAEQAGKFYAVHKERPFYNDLVKFMSSGAIVPAILEKENAVNDFRKLIGATNPANADEGTIRKLFAESVERNAVHGSDSDENAIVEGGFFFSELERF